AASRRPRRSAAPLPESPELLPSPPVHLALAQTPTAETLWELSGLCASAPRRLGCSIHCRHIPRLATAQRVYARCSVAFWANADFPVTTPPVSLCTDPTGERGVSC